MEPNVLLKIEGQQWTGGDKPQAMSLNFTPGNRHITRMETPYGSLDVEVYTSLVQTKLGPEGGYIRLGYTIDLNKQESMNTRLNVEVKKRPAG